MRIALSLVTALIVFVLCVVGANMLSFEPAQALSYDIRGAVEAIAFRLRAGLGFPPQMAMACAAILLATPALLSFHVVRWLVGGLKAARRAMPSAAATERLTARASQGFDELRQRWGRLNERMPEIKLDLKRFRPGKDAG